MSDNRELKSEKGKGNWEIERLEEAKMALGMLKGQGVHPCPFIHQMGIFLSIYIEMLGWGKRKRRDPHMPTLTRPHENPNFNDL